MRYTIMEDYKVYSADEYGAIRLSATLSAASQSDARKTAKRLGIKQITSVELAASQK